MRCEMETSKGRPANDYDLHFLTSSCAEQPNGGAARATLSFQVFHTQQQALVVQQDPHTGTVTQSSQHHSSRLKA
jgi:hypothetical protein